MSMQMCSIEMGLICVKSAAKSDTTFQKPRSKSVRILEAVSRCTPPNPIQCGRITDYRF